MTTKTVLSTPIAAWIISVMWGCYVSPIAIVWSGSAAATMGCARCAKRVMDTMPAHSVSTAVSMDSAGSVTSALITPTAPDLNSAVRVDSVRCRRVARPTRTAASASAVSLMGVALICSHVGTTWTVLDGRCVALKASVSAAEGYPIEPRPKVDSRRLLFTFGRLPSIQNKSVKEPQCSRTEDDPEP